MIQNNRFQMKVGAHLPAISFKEQTIEIDGVTKNQLVPYRFLTPELIPTYTFNKHISIGIYYIYGLGLEKMDQTKHTHFLSCKGNLEVLGEETSLERRERTSRN